MAENRYRIETGERKNIFSRLEKTLRLPDLQAHGIPVKYVPYFLYLAMFCLIYIWNNHQAENNIRQINKLESEVEDLRADYTTLKSDYMYSRLQSEVAAKVAVIGLKESKNPPFKIVEEQE
jgi:hypothetical protein